MPVASAEHSASQPAGPSASSGSDEIWKYVCQMATLHPKINHPPREWIDQHFSDAAPVVRDNSSPEDGVLTLASVKALLEARDARLDERFTKSETAISGFRQRNTLNELSFRGDRLDKREKEKLHRLKAYSNLTLKSHAGDLFDIEQLTSDVLGSAGSAVPDLTAHLRHAATQQSEPMDTGPYMGYVPVQALVPLYQLLSCLQFDVDKMVHNLESCAKSKVGYKAMRESINREEDGDSAFSGSRSDRDYHAALQLHREKNWLQRQAHAKALRAPASGQASGSNSQASTQGGTSARTPAQLLKKKLRNAKNRKQANARKRAAKAEEAKKKAGAGKGAPADP